MNFLITGATGFIGRNLARTLVGNGHSVTALFRDKNKRKNLSFIRNKNILVRDILKVTPKDLHGIHTVIHTASTTNNYHIIQNEPYIDLETNCRGTLKLLEACRQRRTKIIFTSTFFVYGNPRRLPVTEESPTYPLGLYPATKLAAEHIIRIYHNVFSIPFIIIRLTNVYGPGEQTDNLQKGAIIALMYKITQGQRINVYNDGQFYRDFLFIDDAITAIIHLITNEQYYNQTYLVGGEKAKFKTFLETTAKLAGKPLLYKSISPPEFHTKVGINNFFIDKSKLETTGFQNKYTLKQGIETTIKWMKSLN